jgi:hypothetical protein
VSELPPPVRARFDAWVAAEAARAEADLRFADVRRGAQALSSLYVQKRGQGGLARKAADGVGKQAAFASYYAPLHFFAAWHAARDAGLVPAGSAGWTVTDLGCGTAPVSAAVLADAPEAGRARGLDVAAWVPRAALRTWAAFGVAGRARVGRLPGALPKLGPKDLVVAGWSLNELEPADRDAVLVRIAQGLQRGAGLLLLEPLSTRAVPWWPAAAAALTANGAREAEVRVAFDRPEWVARLDQATGLDHRVVGARVLVSAPR